MNFIAILFTSVIVNNILLVKLEGFRSLDRRTKFKTIIVSGLKTAVVGLVSVIVTYPINNYLLAPIGFNFFSPIIVAFVVFGVTVLADLAMNKLEIENTTAAYKTEFMLLNSVVIAALLISSVGPSYFGAIVQVAGFTLGHLFIVLALYTMRPRLDLPGVPKAFKGIPILLVVVALVAMVFLGLKGIF